MKRSESVNELAAALAKAQAEMRPALKDAVNPHFKSKYADLAAILSAIRTPFAAHGLSLTQHPTSDGERVEVITVLLHASGQFLESSLSMVPQQKTPQAVGSAITYARRYAAMAVAGLAADDDDGEAAMPPRKESRAEPPAVDLDAAKVYADTHAQRPVLGGYARKLGVDSGDVATMEKISRACVGVPLERLGAEVKKWVEANLK